MKQVSLGAIVVGALIALVLNFTMTLIGAAVGVSSIKLDAQELPSTGTLVVFALFALLTAFAVFYIAGYVSAKLAPSRTDKFTKSMHGLAAFALAILVIVYAMGTSASSVLGTLVSNAGLSLGASAGAQPMLEQLSKLKIVTDMSMVKGKAVTQLVIPGSEQASTLERSIASVKKQTEKVSKSPEAQEAAKEASAALRKWVIIMSLLTIAFLATGAIASILGAGILKTNRSINY